jgi:hypothetical protein
MGLFPSEEGILRGFLNFSGRFLEGKNLGSFLYFLGPGRSLKKSGEFFAVYGGIFKFFEGDFNFINLKVQFIDCALIASNL